MELSTDVGSLVFEIVLEVVLDTINDIAGLEVVTGMKTGRTAVKLFDRIEDGCLVPGIAALAAEVKAGPVKTA